MSFGSWLSDGFSLTEAEPLPERQASPSYTARVAAVAGLEAEEPEVKVFLRGALRQWPPEQLD